jgi:hypothetical protein
MAVEKIGNEIRFKNPGGLLMVVLGFAFWGVGFLDLLGHTSAEPDVFGLYSLPFFLLILLYALTSVIWFALFFNADLLMRVAGVVKSVQSNRKLADLRMGSLVAPAHAAIRSLWAGDARFRHFSACKLGGKRTHAAVAQGHCLSVRYTTCH